MGRHSRAPTGQQKVQGMRLLATGLAQFRQGEYAAAQRSLQQSMAAYPFFFAAQLTLGKIYLLRGAAVQDKQLLQRAEQLFEMAQQIEPSAPEPRLMLRLLHTPLP